ncbi:MAG: type IA DNA topoisomerase [Lachnospiraceae bacterium]|nr:type IA DNA topoisomerase [Lachnospiraceae bacterium]
MGKSVFIAEKPSVAREFAKALKENMVQKNGYMEGENYIVTWCVGHLVTMCYPESYDAKYKRWSLETIPFIPENFLYQVIDNVKDQFKIVSGILNRKDVDTIYVCTDSGREGEYIYRLVEQMAGVKGKERKRVWIDSQTEEEILRGIREAKDLSEYDALSDAAYLRAKEDYLMGINFSRVLTLKYGDSIKRYLGVDRGVVSVGRVMTCVLGMIVNREREIRNFTKTSFYRLVADFKVGDKHLDGEWRVTEESRYYNSPKLYNEKGFKEEAEAVKFRDDLLNEAQGKMILVGKENKKEVKNPPLLYNLAELQNDCSKLFKISPDETLNIVQQLYEKKMVTYPRTDARVLSTAVAKEIYKNINGLKHYVHGQPFAEEVLANGSYKKIVKSRYVDDKKITDHYAIIPTGQGLNAMGSLHSTAQKVYEVIVRRFLAIFYPPAVYQKIGLVTGIHEERFYSNFKMLVEEGYLKVTKYSFSRKTSETGNAKANVSDSKALTEEMNNASSISSDNHQSDTEEDICDAEFMALLNSLKKGMELPLEDIAIKTGETSPPKRYNSGSIILAMENAGQLIEDEELRAQIKGSGIGTSATRAEILKKLITTNGYIALNKKTQILTPTQLGELIYDVVDCSMKRMLDPALTASWEKGLTGVADGSITSDEYMMKLSTFVSKYTNYVKSMNNQSVVYAKFKATEVFYQTKKKS